VDVRIGISGWRYAGWRGTFYPRGLRQSEELAYASRRLRTIEINGSFYSLQRPSSYAAWYAATPEDFLFSVKGGRFITHNKKLKGIERPLANFFASGVLLLGKKLGAILWQLPPQLSFDSERLERFFELLPRTTKAAAKLARKHDERLRHGAFTDAVVDQRIRYALEVRHETFHDRAFVRLLEAHGIALCIADTAGRWPMLVRPTADFVYVRLHGDKEIYVSGYGKHALDAWASRIASWRGRDVYVYFDNDLDVRAPFDAINLAARLGQGSPERFPYAMLRAARARRFVDDGARAVTQR
jgi:uncharacterized protein YecE (DUF72 family)